MGENRRGEKGGAHIPKEAIEKWPWLMWVETAVETGLDDNVIRIKEDIAALVAFLGYTSY